MLWQGVITFSSTFTPVMLLHPESKQEAWLREKKLEVKGILSLILGQNSNFHPDKSWEHIPFITEMS